MSRVIFLHPDLGIGGAERLVVDAAIALKTHGNIVHIVTTHHDHKHAFQETINGEISVTVVGDWIPRSILNRFYALMAYIRMVYAALYIVFFSDFNPDVVFCDLVSVAVPVLRLKIDNVIFYCHYPDQLLSQPKGYLKALYRAPLNWLEEISMGKASYIFVNSKFTANVFKQTFQRITMNVHILYPSLNMSFFDSFTECSLTESLNSVLEKNSVCYLSINRYERKKNLKLALEAFSELKYLVDENAWNKAHLIIVGGYDTRVSENVEHLDELKKVQSELKLGDQITFLTSVSDAEKISIIKKCTCLIYTPSNEHFGIVPIEAMYLGKPVVAVNNGGPTETIVDGETGFLCDSNSLSFANAMKKFLLDDTLSEKMGKAGRKRVTFIFSFEEFARKLNKTVKDLVERKSK